ncbi:alpha/beta hydrolase family protein [Phenylobacterium sp.]|uniref:alpha/beta hydrolase family protein n=1 Tax=Phenylobacterium sp. TaxID=1871053 RepID=UPI002DF39823|nr:alpha/beta fold hydrolase [Phenylobacterium sp.]
MLLAACAAISLVGANAQARAIALPPAAIYTDPPADKVHPARMEVLHIPSGGVEINGVAYLAAGPGVHPTVVLFHGLPGNEKNLDLAQAIRRDGWNVVTLNYRGSWGSPGTFSFKGNLEDAQATLAYVRSPAVAAKLGVDTRRIVVMGHSMGGWVTAVTGGRDPALAGAALISAADMTSAAKGPPAVRLKLAEDNHESLNVGLQPMADEVATLGPELSFAAAAPGLARHPLLVLTSDDGLGPRAEALAAEVRKRGGRVTTAHAATDHGWSDKRIRLESEVLTWLDSLPK